MSDGKQVVKIAGGRVLAEDIVGVMPIQDGALGPGGPNVCIYMRGGGEILVTANDVQRMVDLVHRLMEAQ